MKFDGILNAGYDLSYTYANNSQQIANIADASYRAERSSRTYATGSVASDSIDHKTHSYRYDANGNRHLAISDNGFVSNYWYDASGERTVKQSGGSEGVFVNGVLSAARTQTSKFTAYVSPYLVVSNGGNYSKHIYVGSQRITSKLSNSLIFDESRNPLSIAKAKASETVDYSAKFNTLTGTIAERFDSLGVIYKGTVQSGGLITQGTTSGVTPQYFYHPDHLGSSSLITDENGLMVQHIQYVPFGEVFVEERTTSWSTLYKFNAKELDPETGLYYYHARYYDPRTSVWLSVDPLAEGYPNISSYVYCAENPVKYVDPDGKRLQVANAESFGVLLSSLPKEARSIIQLDNNGFISNTSVDLALSLYSNSGNLQALKVIVDDNRTVEFDATKTGYDFINTETGAADIHNFRPPTKSNEYQELMSKFKGTPAERQAYSDILNKVGIIDETEVTGNLGATLRPLNEQEPYPGGQASKNSNIQVYVSPVGTNREDKAKLVGHELFSHLFQFLTGKDPRHGGATRTLNGNPQLDQQQDARENESIINSQQ